MSRIVNTVLNPVTGKYVQSLVEFWKFYISKSYDFEMLQCKVQNILKQEKLHLKKENTK